MAYKVVITLQSLLDERGWSHRELARRTGIRHPTISAMCNNQISRMPLEALASICEVLECDISDVMRLEID